MTTELIVREDWLKSELDFKLKMYGINLGVEQLNKAKDMIIEIIMTTAEEIRRAIDALVETLQKVVYGMESAFEKLANIFKDCYDDDDLVFMDNVERRFRKIRYAEYVKQENYYDNCFKLAKVNYNNYHKKLC